MVSKKGKAGRKKKTGEKTGNKKTAKKTRKKKLSPEKKKMNKEAKKIEKAFFAIRFYPVAVNEESKSEALEYIENTYKKGNDTMRQLILYMVHESISKAFQMKIAHTFDYFKMKHPEKEPAQIRMSVYRAMFNYNTSIEGIMEFIFLLGRLEGGDESAKLLTYHFSRFASVENESAQIIRNSILEALGNSNSRYALNALLRYVAYSENERSINRANNSLLKWEDKIESLDISKKEKEELRKRLKGILSNEYTGTRHYG